MGDARADMAPPHNSLNAVRGSREIVAVNDGTVAASEPRKRRKTSPLKRGAIFERMVKERLEAAGAFVLRSAGSRSPVDLVAVFGESASLGLAGVAMVQVKMSRRALPRAERDALVSLARRYDGVRVFHALPHEQPGRIILRDLVVHRTYELPATTNDGQALPPEADAGPGLIQENGPKP